MGTQDALGLAQKHTAIVDAEMRIVVHCMGVKSQVERISLEQVMVDQRDEGIHNGSGGKQRC